jgi:hypothetical protein
LELPIMGHVNKQVANKDIKNFFIHSLIFSYVNWRPV